MNVNILRKEEEVNQEAAGAAWMRGVDAKWSQEKFYTLAKSNDIIENIEAAALILNFANSLKGAFKNTVIATMCVGTHVDVRMDGTVNIG